MKIYENQEDFERASKSCVAEPPVILLDSVDSYYIHNLYDTYSQEHLRSCCSDRYTWQRLVMMLLSPHNIKAKKDVSVTGVVLAMPKDIKKLSRAYYDTKIVDLLAMTDSVWQRLVAKYSEGLLLSLCYGDAIYYLMSRVVGHKIDKKLFEY